MLHIHRKNYYTIQCFYGLYSPTQWLTRYRTDRFPYAVASQRICVCLYSYALEYEYECPKYNEVVVVVIRFVTKIFHFLCQSQMREDIRTCWPGLLGNNHIHIVWHERQWIIISLENTNGSMCVRRMRMLCI